MSFAFKCDSCEKFSDERKVIEYKYFNAEQDLRGVPVDSVEVRFGWSFDDVDLCPRCATKILATAIFNRLPEDLRNIFQRTLEDLTENEADKKSYAALYEATEHENRDTDDKQ